MNENYWLKDALLKLQYFGNMVRVSAEQLALNVLVALWRANDIKGSLINTGLITSNSQGCRSHSAGGANAPPTFGPVELKWEHAPPTFLAVKR